MHFYYVDLINRFKADLDAYIESEAKANGEKLDRLYAREQLNYKRYEAALQRCRELLGKVAPSLSGELLDEVKIFQGILADMLHEKVDDAWIKTAALEKAEFYKEWLKKREEEGK